jgi:glutaminyl-peptide cyclotransferase
MLLDGSNVKACSLPPHLFGEGITVFGDDIIQLTWKARIGIVWDKKTLKVKSIFHYPTEGWGITNDGQWLIMSDGSATLFFLDPSTFTLHHRILVTDKNGPVRNLNELEYVKGEIWANIWRDNRIARIDSKSGEVTGWIDLTGLVAMAAPGENENVLNGIAYDAENDRIFVTGKRWNQLFEINVVEKKKDILKSEFENK